MNFSDRTYHGDHCTPGDDPHLLTRKVAAGIFGRATEADDADYPVSGETVIALLNNPQITVGRLRMLQAAQFTSEQRSALLPTAYLSPTGVDASHRARIATSRPSEARIYRAWYGTVGVNVSVPVFNGFLYLAHVKTADLQTEVAQQKLRDERNNTARDVRTSGLDSQRAFAGPLLSREQRLGETPPPISSIVLHSSNLTPATSATYFVTIPVTGYSHSFDVPVRRSPYVYVRGVKFAYSPGIPFCKLQYGRVTAKRGQ